MWRKDFKVPGNLSGQDILDFWAAELRPHSVKVQTVINYGAYYKINTLIETGTYRGDMLKATLPQFKKLYSIELDPTLYLAAKIKFAPYPHVNILLGDSGKVLPGLLRIINEPCVFWLDGHYIPLTLNTAKGNVDTPIMQELSAILDHPIKNHVILIDDARCFIGPNKVLKNYPTIREMKEFVAKKRSDLKFEVKDDIIHIYST
jgi:hypothetical protein